MKVKVHIVILLRGESEWEVIALVLQFFWDDASFTKISLEMSGHSNGVWYYWLLIH